MVILITGASHTGKTLQAQKLMERYKMCRANGCPLLLIEDRYPEEIDEKLLFGE